MPQKRRGQTPVEEAVTRILNALDVPEKTEEIPLLQALGRVAAGDVCARVAQPPFDRSALDGYALRAADIAAAGPETPVTLPVSRYLCAGSDPGGPLAPGTAARIMTGAPVPAGADCVLRQEDTESNGQTVTLHAPVEARANVCFAGEDIAPGKCLVPAGTRLDEVSLGLLAGQGVQTVTVYAKPRAALMPTGDELCSPETPLRPGKIYDSNGPMLAARMLRLGAETPCWRQARMTPPRWPESWPGCWRSTRWSSPRAACPSATGTTCPRLPKRPVQSCCFTASTQSPAPRRWRRGKTGMSCSASPATPLPALRRSSCWPGLHWPNCRGQTPPPCG